MIDCCLGACWAVAPSEPVLRRLVRILACLVQVARVGTLKPKALASKHARLREVLNCRNSRNLNLTVMRTFSTCLEIPTQHSVVLARHEVVGQGQPQVLRGILRLSKRKEEDAPDHEKAHSHGVYIEGILFLNCTLWNLLPCVSGH